MIARFSAFAFAGAALLLWYPSLVASEEFVEVDPVYFQVETVDNISSHNPTSRLAGFAYVSDISNFFVTNLFGTILPVIDVTVPEFAC